MDTAVIVQYFALGVGTWFTVWGLNRVYLFFKSAIY